MINDIHYFNYTRSNPYEKLDEMNSNEGNMFDYKIEFIKRANDYETKGELLESLLNQMGTSIDPKRHFYQIDKDILYGMLSLVDGEWIS